MARTKSTMDGNHAAAHVSYAFTEVAAIYPITPSSVMAEVVDEKSANGAKNLFGDTVKVVEMQSEAGAAGAVHGSLAAGALTTTFTASQGLLLMIPNMYKIAGELLPCVINVSARALAAHALSIFGDHSDVMACRQTGFAMLASSNVQEVMDLTAVAHLSAIKGRVPFLNFFDGFRTSHEVQKIDTWDYKDLAEMLDWDAVAEFRNNALNPAKPVQRGTAQNPDIFFQAKEASNRFYDNLPAVVEGYMNDVNNRIGTDYRLFNYYGAEDAETVVVAMGSACDTIEETIDYLLEKGEKVGLIKVRLYRPFVADKFIAEIPATAKNIVVLDRTKEPGALGEPLYLDVVAALHSGNSNLKILSGRYGLGSKDTTPAQIVAVFDNAKAANAKTTFTVGIIDDVTNLSLDVGANPDTTPKGTTSCKFWGLGSDGTVSANKNSIMIIGDHTNMYAQAYFEYDSKKSGGVTISHLRFGTSPIHSTYLINNADFVACHNPAYIGVYDMVQDVKPNGTFLINCQWDKNELESNLPAKDKRYIAENNINLYTIDANRIDKELGLRGRINTVLQSAFFSLANIIDTDDAITYMKEAAFKSYGRRGEEVVKMNNSAIDRGSDAVVKIDVPSSWKDSVDTTSDKKVTGTRPELVKFVDKVLNPIAKGQGNLLPVSTFYGAEDGHMPQGSSAYEKRGIAVNVPEWQPENCIQCNFCSYVCPHAVVRPVALTETELGDAPLEMKAIDMNGLENMKFAMTISVLDCIGCGSCANVCPGRRGESALVMKPLVSQEKEAEIFAYGLTIESKPEVESKFSDKTVKGSQFKQPLLEFSGACGGCGETPYAKLITQLFGERMYIANATGCSSIWGGSAPSTPYTVNKEGRGPAWANSLFEDNAEYALGMLLGQKTIRNRLAVKVAELIAIDYCTDELKQAGQTWLDSYDDSSNSLTNTKALIAALEEGVDVDLTGTEWEKDWLANNKVCMCEACTLANEILRDKDYLLKKSVWAFGGDGWAYDIGFGGLDHVIASGENVNIMVFDTEVYSNTGGQSSKSTPTGAVAQFAAAGKDIKKKDLAAIAMSYGYVYVAQIGMGADMNQTIKALHEAESYDGPSLIIAYAPCINHGVKGGMANSQAVIKRAVAAGYWHNFRYDPRLTLEGKNPFQLDSKEPNESYEEFIMSEVRYNSLVRKFPERARELFDKADRYAKDKYAQLEKRATN